MEKLTVALLELAAIQPGTAEGVNKGDFARCLPKRTVSRVFVSLLITNAGGGRLEEIDLR